MLNACRFLHYRQAGRTVLRPWRRCPHSSGKQRECTHPINISVDVRWVLVFRIKIRRGCLWVHSSIPSATQTATHSDCVPTTRVSEEPRVESVHAFESNKSKAINDQLADARTHERLDKKAGGQHKQAHECSTARAERRNDRRGPTRRARGELFNNDNGG